MLKPYRKTNYEEAIAHAEGILASFRELDETREMESHAASLGIGVAYSLHHTYDESQRANYICPDSTEGALPNGYTLEIWVDLTKDGYVLASTSGEEDRLQYSVSFPVVVHVEGMVYFFNRVDFLSFETVMKKNQANAMLESFLDEIEENGAQPSPFRTDSTCPVLPVGDLRVVFGVEDLEAGNYTELSPRPYDGTVGGKHSVFVGEHAFLPLRLFLLGCTDLPRWNTPAALTLTEEELTVWLDLLGEVPYVMEEYTSFTDLLDGVGIHAYAPPPNAETLLWRLTYGRKTDFLSDTARLADWLTAQKEEGNPVTLIW